MNDVSHYILSLSFQFIVESIHCRTSIQDFKAFLQYMTL